MAGVSTGGGGHGGKKSVDQDVPLVPYIDLLLCCVMFLLVTAVWNQLARINANQQTPGQVTTPPDEPPPEKVRLVLAVQNTGFVIQSSAGESITIPKNGDQYNLVELNTKLNDVHQMDPNRRDIIVEPEDGVKYEDVVKAMDAVVGANFPDFSLSASSTLQ